jgi:hypothetical protein
MKKCPDCSKEIQSEAIKCKHCGKLLGIDSPTKLGGIWNKYWGYIIGIPIIIICITSIILSIADFDKDDRPAFDPFSKTPSVANRSMSEQYVNQRNSLMGMSDEQFKKIADENHYLASIGVRYEMKNGKMIRYIPSPETMKARDDNRPPVNDETYNTPDNVPDTVKDSENKQRQEELHRKQIQQLNELYR